MKRGFLFNFMAIYLFSAVFAVQGGFVQIDFNGMDLGTLTGQPAVGTGVTGNWTGAAGIVAGPETEGFTELEAPPSCNFKLTQSSAPSRALTGNSLNRSRIYFTEPLGGKGRRIWGSFLLKIFNTGNAGIGFDVDYDSHLHCFGNGDNGKLNMWFSKNEGGSQDTQTGVLNEGTNLIIFRIEPDYTNELDRLDIWANPDVTQLEEEPTRLTVLNNNILGGDSLKGLKYFTNGTNPSTIDLITLCDEEDAYARVTGTESLEPSLRGGIVQIDFNDMELGEIKDQAAKGKGVTGKWQGRCKLVEGDLQPPASCHFRLKQRGEGRSLTGNSALNLFNGETWIPLMRPLGGCGKVVWGSFLLNFTLGGNGAVGFDGSGAYVNSFGGASSKDNTRDLQLWFSKSHTQEGVIQEGTNLLLFRIIPGHGGNDSIEVWVNPDVRTIDPDAAVGTTDAFHVDEKNFLPRDLLCIVKYNANSNSKELQPCTVDLITLSDGPKAFADVTGYDRSRLGTTLIFQ